MSATPHPSIRSALVMLGLIFTAMLVTGAMLLGVEDQVRLKALIEDAGPVQMFGQTCIFLAFGLACCFALLDRQRRVAYTQLSYLLMFYALREADFHYKVSEHAKATQFKRFFSHELIPISTKLFLAGIVLLFLVVMYRYLRTQLPTFLAALRAKLPWAMTVLAWGLVFFLSQAVDQIPAFHNVTGQVFEEIFESGAEVLVLLAMLQFRLQVRADSHSGPMSSVGIPRQ
jgi:hypothetical protein